MTLCTHTKSETTFPIVAYVILSTAKVSKIAQIVFHIRESRPPKSKMTNGRWEWGITDAEPALMTIVLTIWQVKCSL